MRAYLAVAGGIDVPLVMGSRSTYIKAAIGGLDGRPLKAGDTISAFQAPPASTRARHMPPDAVPAYGSEQTLRVILGPQHSAFTQRGIDTFLNSTYTVSIYSDRMGYRLDGPAVEHKDGADVISDGTPMGAVQVPGDGKPIVLLADRGHNRRLHQNRRRNHRRPKQDSPGDARAARSNSAPCPSQRRIRRSDDIRRFSTQSPNRRPPQASPS